MSKTTADRVLGIMDLFLSEQVEWSVEEAAQVQELPVSTVYRYFKSLASSGFIYAYVPGRYVIGPAIVQFDRQMRIHDPLIHAAEPQMNDFPTEQVEDAVLMLARYYHDQVMCVHQFVIGQPNFAVSYERGRLLPLHLGAASKAILANLSPRSYRNLELAGGESELIKVVTEDLRKELKKIRAQGFALTTGELDQGVRGLSVPIFQTNQTVIGSLSIIISDQCENYENIISQLILCQKRIEADLVIQAGNYPVSD